MELGPLILVVDDQPDAARALSRLLKFRGHEVRAVEDGAEALAFVETHKTDLVVLDVMMPGMDGISVLKSIRKNPELDDTKVIMFSAGDNQETVRKSQQLGAVGFILKGSISADRLLSQIESFLPNASQQQ
jgi:CheY-like chemotaxis protein